MGRKKLNLTDEERILRKKEQMQRVYERQKLLKKRRVENLKPEQLEKKRSRDRIENLSPEQLEKLRTRRRIENLKPEQLEKKRMHNIKYYENLKNKRLKLMLGLYEARPQVEYLDEIDVSNTGIFIKEEKIDEIEEEEKDETVPIVDIKEEKGSVFLWDGLIPEPGGETFVQDDGGLSYVKQEEEMIIPDHVSAVGIKHEEGLIFYCGGLIPEQLGEKFAMNDGDLDIH